MSRVAKVFVLCACLLAWRTTSGAESPGSRGHATGIALVREMEDFPERLWPRCSAAEYPDDVALAVSDWKQKAAAVAPQVTPNVVRALSRWAEREMEAYTSVPPLSETHLALAGKNDSRRQLLLEGTVDTLPSHSVLVTRWLKLYLVYSLETRSVVRVTVTIRGQLLE